MVGILPQKKDNITALQSIVVPAWIQYFIGENWTGISGEKKSMRYDYVLQDIEEMWIIARMNGDNNVNNFVARLGRE